MQVATYHRIKRGKDATCTFFLQHAKPNYEVSKYTLNYIIECITYLCIYTVGLISAGCQDGAESSGDVPSTTHLLGFV